MVQKTLKLDSEVIAERLDNIRSLRIAPVSFETTIALPLPRYICEKPASSNAKNART